MWKSFFYVIKYMRPETGSGRVLNIYAPRDRFREGFKYISLPAYPHRGELNIFLYIFGGPGRELIN